LIIALGEQLAGRGRGAGPPAIAWHLHHHHQATVSAATISRYLTRAGLVVPGPSRRPQSSCIGFAAELPTGCWQAGFTHDPLAAGTGSEIVTWLGDQSRYALPVTAWNRVTGPVVLATFGAAANRLRAARPRH